MEGWVDLGYGQCTGRESNSRSLDHKFSALTTTLPSNPSCCSWNKIVHLTSTLLQHYLAKIECSTVLHYGTSLNANVMQNHLIRASAYQRCFTCLHRLICNIAACAKLVWSQKRRMLWVVHATGQWMCQWRVVKCCSAKRLAGFWQMLNDISSSLKISSKLHINQSTRNTS